MDEDTKKIVNECIDTLVFYQSYLTNDECLELWGRLSAGYCRNCGDYVGADVCHCENDE